MLDVAVKSLKYKCCLTLFLEARTGNVVFLQILTLRCIFSRMSDQPEFSSEHHIVTIRIYTNRVVI